MYIMYNTLSEWIMQIYFQQMFVQFVLILENPKMWAVRIFNQQFLIKPN